MKIRLMLIAIIAVISISTLAQQQPLPESNGATGGRAGVRVVNPQQLVQLPHSQLQNTLGTQQTLVPSTQASTAGLPTFWFGGGTIVGTIPTDPSTTTIQVDVVPVILNITQGGTLFTFDPTHGDPGCIPTNYTAFNLFAGSPFFASVPITINGVSEGTTQYLDAFQRAELAYVDPNHHTMLFGVGFPALTISANVPAGGNSTAAVFSLGGTQCGNSAGPLNPQGMLGIYNFNNIDGVLRNYISARGAQIQPSHLVFFLLYNSVMATNPADIRTCCVTGYHSMIGGSLSLPGQTYAIGDFEGRNQTAFPGVADVSVISHELAEWANDPSGQNPVPAWGNIGQLLNRGCQANLEVGDPLSGTLAPSIPYGVFTFHFQELAFLSWFVGDHPSQGAGGKYSSNGTFSGYAQPCPPGGTF